MIKLKDYSDAYYYRKGAIYNDFKRFLMIDQTSSYSTVANYICMIRKMLNQIDKPINEITKDDIRNCLALFSEKYSIQTYNCTIKAIRKFFRDFLGKPELVSSFKFKPVPFSPKVKSLTKDELVKFYDSIEHPVVKMMFHMYCVTGLRRSDVLFLKLNELNRDKRMVIKNNSSRTKHKWITFYNQELAETLHPYLDSRTDNSDRVFRIDPFRTFQREWKLAKEKSGFNITPKDLRDFFINEMLRLKVPESYIDAFVGHIPKSILSRHYVIYDADTLKQVYDSANIKLFS